MNSAGLEDNEMFMRLTPDCEKSMRHIFEIEMLQGERWEQDGMIHYNITLCDEKARAVKKWMLDMYPQPITN